MPPGFCNVGVLLRWAAGLHEMETLEAADRAARAGWRTPRQTVRDVGHRDARSLATGVRARTWSTCPRRTTSGDWQLGGVNTIVSVRLR